MDTLSLLQTSRTTFQHSSAGNRIEESWRCARIKDRTVFRRFCCGVGVAPSFMVPCQCGGCKVGARFDSDHTSLAGDRIIATRGLLFTTSLVQELLLFWAASGWWKANRFTSVPWTEDNVSQKKRDGFWDI